MRISSSAHPRRPPASSSGRDAPQIHRAPELMAAMVRSAEGVVVGSALVSALAESTGTDDAVARATAFLAPLRAALDAG